MTNADITFDPAPTCADKLRAKDLEILEEDARRHGVPAITSAITAREPVVARPVVETPCLTVETTCTTSNVTARTCQAPACAG